MTDGRSSEAESVPLTLSLSHRERGPRWMPSVASGPASRSGTPFPLAPREETPPDTETDSGPAAWLGRETFLPLPAGEGRGEG